MSFIDSDTELSLHKNTPVAHWVWFMKSLESKLYVEYLLATKLQNLFHWNDCDGLRLHTKTLTNTSSFSCPKGTDKLAMFLSIPTCDKTVSTVALCLVRFRLSSIGLSPSQKHCVVFLDKTVNSHSTSIYLPQVYKYLMLG